MLLRSSEAAPFAPFTPFVTSATFVTFATFVTSSPLSLQYSQSMPYSARSSALSL